MVSFGMRRLPMTRISLMVLVRGWLAVFAAGIDCSEVWAIAPLLSPREKNNAQRTGTVRQIRRIFGIRRIHGRDALGVGWFGTWKPPTLAEKICTPSLP